MIDNFHDIERFCEVARAEELDLTPENIVIDGPTANRCHLIGERGKKNGAYHVYSDSVLAGWYQNHKGGEVKTWCSRSKDEIPRAEWDAIRARVAADQKKRAEELARARAEAAIKAREIWNKSALCTSHPYLTTKGVKSHGLRTTTRDYDLICSDGEHSMHVCAGALVIPAWDADENLHTVEFIDDGGNKLFMPAGHKQAHFFIIGYITGRAGERVVQVEGFGTGATVHESTDYPVVVAFDCGNQLPVAKAILEKYPQIDLAIVADDDWKAKTGNPGVTHATEAAKETGARLIIPRWSGERPEKSTDMDDLGRDEGRAEVKKQIDAGFSALKKTTTAEIWPDPEPLLGGMPDVPAFAAELLPVSLRDWIKDIAERLQCPIEYVAMTALSTLGSLIGRQCVIRPKRHDDWSIVANLWSAIVGPPSAMKSPAMAEALKPLRRLALKAAEDYAKAMKYHDADKAMAEAKRSAVKDKMKQAAKTNDKASDGQSLRDQFLAATEPQEIIQRRFSTSDSTTEKLGELLTENPNGLLVERDELVGFFRLLDRDGHEADRAFYLTAHDGTHPYIQDRIGRGTTFIPAVCVTISGGIQPGVLGQYMAAAIRGGAGDDGLVQRFQLMVYPDVCRHWRRIDRWPDREAKERAFVVFEKLANLSPSMAGATVEAGELPYLHFDDSAQNFFDNWLSDLMNRLRAGDEHPAIEAHLSKYTKLMPALALINHLADDGQGAVPVVSAERAAALCDLLEAHARRVYACSTAEKLRAARSLLAKIQAGKLTSPFTSREIYKSGWAGLTEREVVEEALTTLVGHGWLRAIKVEQPGRPLVVYHAHPDAMTRTVDLGVLGVTVSRNPELPSASRAAQKKGV